MHRKSLMDEISRQRLARDLIVIQEPRPQNISEDINSRSIKENSRLSDTNYTNNQLKVETDNHSVRMRPRSPVGVQEWVASLPLPSKMSDFEPLSDETLQKSQDVSHSNPYLPSSSKEKLKYQDKHFQNKEVYNPFWQEKFISFQSFGMSEIDKINIVQYIKLWKHIIIH